ncbi:hypothetical protein AQ505_08785 [Pedobacter sp. PACM 27299]|uniref:hypothetical protein n=1 Tax=Pedobacter sp. PACM 27299 TaxID=1727164 RepID=UPI0007059194|nr:hypothetical protein [Pedobacter sp. PACM 27299]ALL05577.1 hypothetical protein AQ505_08785 [Pedobacter sp. PACM 27299]
MPRTDNFNLETKRVLAKRVGYHCSFLGCGNLTAGPSDENDEATSETGMACHITAASGGGSARRYDPDMESADRKSAANGIWCCYTHGKLIDTDETRFSIKMLKDWKQIAETTARIMVEKGCNYDAASKHFAFRELIAETINVGSMDTDSQTIGDLLKDCGVELSWGKENAHILRDLIIELTRNALSHGKATEVKILIADDNITLIDNGAKFNPKLSLTHGTGGTWAAAAMRKLEGDKIIWVYYHEFGQNISRMTYIGKNFHFENITPCSIEVNRTELYKGEFKIKVTETCEDIYVIIPLYLVYSDIALVEMAVKGFDTKGKTVTLICRHVSSGVIEQAKIYLPEFRIIGVE